MRSILCSDSGTKNLGEGLAQFLNLIRNRASPEPHTLCYALF